MQSNVKYKYEYSIYMSGIKMQAQFLWQKKRNDLDKVLYFTESERRARKGHGRGAEENLSLEAEYKWPPELRAQHYMTVMTAAPSPAFNENDF